MCLSYLHLSTCWCWCAAHRKWLFTCYPHQYTFGLSLCICCMFSWLSISMSMAMALFLCAPFVRYTEKVNKSARKTRAAAAVLEGFMSMSIYTTLGVWPSSHTIIVGVVCWKDGEGRQTTTHITARYYSLWCLVMDYFQQIEEGCFLLLMLLGRIWVFWKENVLDVSNLYHMGFAGDAQSS